MNPLRVRDALVSGTQTVWAEERPQDHPIRSIVYVVWGGAREAPLFLGLVTLQTVVRFPYRIFADLVSKEVQLAAGGDDTAEDVVHRPDFREVEAIAVLDGEGAFLGAATRESIMDALLIAERALHDALRSREDELRAVFAAMPDLVFCVDRRGDCLRVLGCPKGFDYAPLLGGPLTTVMAKEAVDELRAEIKRVLDGGGVGSVAARISWQGRILAYELRFASLGGDTALCVARDATEISRLRAELVLADRLVVMGTLAASIAHEINNPLAYVMSSAELLAGALKRVEALPPSLEEAPPLVEAIAEGAARIRGIVRDLSVLAKGDSDAATPVDVRRVLRSTINVVMPHIRPRARLVTEFEDVPPVLGNEARIGQVFMNLLMNAAQAIPEGAPGDNVVRVSLKREAASLHVVVADSGVGLTEEARAHMFEAFFTTKSATHGTGFGLFVSSIIVESLGGRMYADETPAGGGAVFHVVLPVKAEARPAAEEAPPSRQGTAVGRILVIDDEPMILRTMKRALRPHVVETAQSGEVALALLANGGPYDVIICDVMMPGMSGIELYRHACARTPELGPRFVFFTGGVYADKMREILSSFHNEVLYKPLEIKLLRDVIARRMSARPLAP